MLDTHFGNSKEPGRTRRYKKKEEAMQLLICSEAGDQLRGEQNLREVRLVALLQEAGLRCMEPRMSNRSLWQASTRKVSCTSKTHINIYELRRIL